MDKEMCMKIIADAALIAVIRARNKEQALNITKAVYIGGVNAIEVTMTVPGALEVIEHLVKNKEENTLIGAGTVLDSETARHAILAGADFVVSPCLNVEVVRTCNRYRILTMPGAMTITEIVNGMEAGADVIKVFPGNVLGPGFIKAVKGPLPHAKLVPTGGVSLDNVIEWIKNGSLAVGVGSELTRGADENNYKLVSSTARSFVEKITKARKDNENGG